MTRKEADEFFAAIIECAREKSLIGVTDLDDWYSMHVNRYLDDETTFVKADGSRIHMTPKNERIIT